MDKPAEFDQVNEYFWIVWRVESPNPQRRSSMPTVKYATQAKARAEAERLAGANPGVTFATLEVKSTHRAKGKRKRVKGKPLKG